jgi:hypothetical protein
VSSATTSAQEQQSFWNPENVQFPITKLDMEHARTLEALIADITDINSQALEGTASGSYEGFSAAAELMVTALRKARTVLQVAEGGILEMSALELQIEPRLVTSSKSTRCSGHTGMHRSPSSDILAITPSNSFSLYSYIFDIRLTICQESLPMQSNALNCVESLCSVLMYNIGTLYALKASNAIVVASCENHSCEGKKMLGSKSPPQAARCCMMKALDVLQRAVEISANDDIATELDSSLLVLRLAALNNLAYLWSHFLCVDQMVCCLELMRLTLAWYYYHLSNACAETDLVEEDARQDDRDFRMQPDCLAIFEMNIVLLRDPSSVAAAPAA